MRSKTNGFALIDALIAMGLMAVALSFLGVVYSAGKISKTSRTDIIALYIAQNKMDELKNTSFTALAEQSNITFSDSNLTKLKNGQAVYTVALFDVNNDATPDPDMKKITVTVTWTQNTQSKNLTLSALVGETGLSP